MIRELKRTLLLTAVSCGFPLVAMAQMPMGNDSSMAMMMRSELDGNKVLPASDLPPLPAMPSGFMDFDQAGDFAGQTYSLDSVLQLAAGNNPTIEQSRHHISAETAKALQAGLYPNPFLMYVGEKINSDGSAGEFQGFELSQRIVTASKLEISRQKYCERAHVAEHLAVAQQYRVSNAVQSHFYEALAAFERLALRQELLKSAEDVAVTSRELYNQGQTNEVGLRRANVNLQKHRLDVLAAENEYRDSFRRLSAVVGVVLSPGMVEGQLRATETIAPFDEVLASLITESPEILAARAKLRVDQTTVSRELVEWIPDITIQGGPGYNFTNNDPVYNAAIKIELPVHDRNQGTIRQARHDLARQQLEIQRLELQLRERLAMAYRKYATALQHATEYDATIIPELKSAYGQLLASYKDNRVEWLQVLEGQRDYFSARLHQIEHLKEVRVHETMIQGYLLEGGLTAADGPVPPGHIDAVPKPR